MAYKSYSENSYFELAEHNTVQLSIFTFIAVIVIIFIFLISLPLLQKFFESILNGQVFNAGEMVTYSLEGTLPLKKTYYFLSWAVDVYLKTPEEARYWFNPILSLFLQSALIGLSIAIAISSLLPRNLGLMRQKIEREIESAINKIALIKYGYNSSSEHQELINEIMYAKLSVLYDYVGEWGYTLEDLKILQKALIWRQSSTRYKFMHLNDGLKMYMRFYFTVMYSNTVLGLVYIGAAVLIIIIGLRGLKFIPPTQPSLVIFALGLEFSLLITYAFTLMYSKQDEETETDRTIHQRSSENLYGEEFANSKEVEKLLRVFIKSSSKDSKSYKRK